MYLPIKILRKMFESANAIFNNARQMINY